MTVPPFSDQDGGRDVIIRAKNTILWQKAGLSAMQIKRQYENAKMEYKGKPLSVWQRQEQETKL